MPDLADNSQGTGINDDYCRSGCSEANRFAARGVPAGTPADLGVSKSLDWRGFSGLFRRVPRFPPDVPVSTGRASIGAVDAQLVHLELQNAPGDAQARCGSGLVPILALQGFAQDFALEAGDQFLEIDFALAPFLA